MWDPSIAPMMLGIPERRKKGASAPLELGDARWKRNHRWLEPRTHGLGEEANAPGFKIRSRYQCRFGARHTYRFEAHAPHRTGFRQAISHQSRSDKVSSSVRQKDQRRCHDEIDAEWRPPPPVLPPAQIRLDVAANKQIILGTSERATQTWPRMTPAAAVRVLRSSGSKRNLKASKIPGPLWQALIAERRCTCASDTRKKAGHYPSIDLGSEHTKHTRPCARWSPRM